MKRHVDIPRARPKRLMAESTLFLDNVRKRVLRISMNLRCCGRQNGSIDETERYGIRDAGRSKTSCIPHPVSCIPYQQKEPFLKQKRLSGLLGKTELFVCQYRRVSY